MLNIKLVSNKKKKMILFCWAARGTIHKISYYFKAMQM